jgi:peptide/nickel transport system permease protein
MNSTLARWWDSDLAWNFRHSPVAIVSVIVASAMVAIALFAPWLAPHNPFDLASINLLDARLPPAWAKDGVGKFLLGTDDQGRDVLSTIMYGARISLLVSVLAVVFSVIVGVSLGLLSGYIGGAFDALVMRIVDVQLSFPAILVALLISGVAQALFKGAQFGAYAEWIAIGIMVFAIGATDWVQYARTVRGSAMVERNKEYVQAARVIGVSSLKIAFTHVLPNVLGPVMVIATIRFGLAIITEATLSFLGVGMPPTLPSLGTLILDGQKVLLSGEWWITIFPGLALVLLVLSFNLVGDWLRDALNPKLQ